MMFHCNCNTMRKIVIIIVHCSKFIENEWHVGLLLHSCTGMAVLASFEEVRPDIMAQPSLPYSPFFFMII